MAVFKDEKKVVKDMVKGVDCLLPMTVAREVIGLSRTNYDKKLVYDQCSKSYD